MMAFSLTLNVQPGTMQLSIVTTMYNAAPYVAAFYDRISSSARKITDSFEILFVNDGSPDDSLQVALSLFHKDENVKIIDFSRNFGHHKAIMTGLAYAKGDYIFLIDVDLEEAPELLGDFWDAFHAASDIDVVYGVQDRRRGGWLQRLTGQLFYDAFNFLSPYRLPPNQVTSRLMSRRYVDALTRHREQMVLFGGLSVHTGFQQAPLKIHKSSTSPTTYRLKDKIGLFLNAVVSFSSKPLVFIFYLGSLFFLLSLMYCLYLIFNKVFLGHNVEGWTSLIASVWLVGGIVVFALGIISIYMATIFVEVKDRPYTIIRKVYDKDHDQRP
jgi:putative glycosyltransferase